MIEVESLAIPEVKIIRPKKFGDERGFFSETYNKRSFEEAGLDSDFVQDNHSLSADVGTVRGLHFQIPPFAQTKLVRVTRGAILDVAVDIRHGSPTYGKFVMAEISAEAWNQILIPRGFAHGLCTLVPDTEVLYKVDAFYSKECDKGVLWNDPQIGIPWPTAESQAILSDKDREQPRLAELPVFFKYMN